MWMMLLSIVVSAWHHSLAVPALPKVALPDPPQSCPSPSTGKRCCWGPVSHRGAVNPGMGTRFLGVGSRLSAQVKPHEPATSPAAFKAPFLPSPVMQPPVRAGASAKGCAAWSRERTAAPAQWIPVEAWQ